MIRAQGLTKIYSDKERGEFKAAENISFECEPGSVFGLLGPNGAGKTTTLRMLATLIKPTRGTATINGFDIVKEARKVRENIGFMTGETAIYDRLTAREMIRYFGQLFGLEKEKLDQRIEAILDLLDMRHFADKRNDKLSTGMRQKVSIARTIVHDPPCLILDEPTTGLDVLTSKTIVDFIHQAREMGKSVLFSTHIMSEAERLCDQIAIIHNGHILAIGSIEELKTKAQAHTLEDMFINMVNQTEIDGTDEAHH
ncbi:MAG: ATP-binding cassette domain-containing protein [Gemmatimonadetes bacterium]|nr:MAG: ATP-binding cassette domain-containing protein [Gemmatimonadota bacterium]